jgi:hypothetical protein
MNEQIKNLKQEMHTFVNLIDKVDIIKDKLLKKINKNEETQASETEFNDEEYSKMKIDIQKIRQAIKEAYNQNEESL